MERWKALLFRSTRVSLDREEAPTQLRRNMALIPADSIAGRALVIVIAIMTFLASLAGGGAILIHQASRGWDGAISDQMTIQIIPEAGRNIDQDVAAAAAIARRTAGVSAVRIYSSAEANRMLEPWLGDGLDLSELPIPRLIALKLSPGERVDAPALRRALEKQVPSAALDDHHGWVARLTTMARSLVIFAVIVFVLVLTAMGLAVGFATRGAMAGNREIIDVLHFVGAEDLYVTRQFQRHFMRLGLEGGLIGGVFAILAFVLFGFALSLWSQTAGADQMEALFGSISLGFPGYVGIALIAGAVALLTGGVSRTIVYRHLRRLT